MLFPITFFLFFFTRINVVQTTTHQIEFITKCSDNNFGVCSSNQYCEKINDKYECLVCPLDKYCFGDGYVYPSKEQLPKYIVSDHKTPEQRVLFKKKLKRIGKIVKVGLKVAAIAKTGGVAGLKAVAAEKAKEFAIKKGIQCLRNGLSNFCNGKSKIKIIKMKPGISKIKTFNLRNSKSKLTKIKGKKTNSINKAKLGKAKSGKAKSGKVKSGKVKSGKVKSGKVKSGKAKLGRAKLGKAKLGRAKLGRAKSGKAKLGRAKLGKKGSKTIKFNPTKSKKKFNFKLCKNVFDNVADKLKNVTKHMADGAVNKGREWLKNKFGNDCDKISKNIKKSKQNNDNILSSDDKSPSPVLIDKNTPSDDNIKPIHVTKLTNNKIRPPRHIRTNKPIMNTDDNTRPPRHIRTNKPMMNTDDNTRPPRFVRRHVRKITIAPIQITYKPYKQTITRSTKNPSASPSVRPSVRPSARPSARPSKIPTVTPTIIPTVIPTTPPTPWPTYQQLTWAMFSAAPTIYTNIPPTLVPTKSMFTILTNTPTNIKTNTPSFRATPTPSSIHPTVIITRSPTQQPTQQPSRQPTQNPTPIITQNPTNVLRDIYTSPPTSNTLSSLSKDSGSNSQQSGLNTTIAIIIVIVIVFFIVIFSYFIIKNKGCEKSSAYNKWVNHYGNNKMNNKSNENQDIHHFYSKSAPPFKPHISMDNRKRYSMQPQRLSLSPSRRSSMIDRNTML